MREERRCELPCLLESNRRRRLQMWSANCLEQSIKREMDGAAKQRRCGGDGVCVPQAEHTLPLPGP
jgi:hypothetical protein